MLFSDFTKEIADSWPRLRVAPTDDCWLAENQIRAKLLLGTIYPSFERWFKAPAIDTRGLTPDEEWYVMTEKPVVCYDRKAADHQSMWRSHLCKPRPPHEGACCVAWGGGVFHQDSDSVKRALVILS